MVRIKALFELKRDHALDGFAVHQDLPDGFLVDAFQGVQGGRFWLERGGFFRLGRGRLGGRRSQGLDGQVGLLLVFLSDGGHFLHHLGGGLGLLHALSGLTGLLLLFFGQRIGGLGQGGICQGWDGVFGW